MGNCLDCCHQCKLQSALDNPLIHILLWRCQFLGKLYRKRSGWSSTLSMTHNGKSSHTVPNRCSAHRTGRTAPPVLPFLLPLQFGFLSSMVVPETPCTAGSAPRLVSPLSRGPLDPPLNPFCKQESSPLLSLDNQISSGIWGDRKCVGGLQWNLKT